MSNDLPPLSGPVDASGEPADIMRAARARADRVDADYERLIAATVPSSPAQEPRKMKPRPGIHAEDRCDCGQPIAGCCIDCAVAAVAEAVDVQLLAWAVSNCHTLARRSLAKTASMIDREKWEHVLRICEKAGARSKGVLRASLPTEITDGSGERK